MPATVTDVLVRIVLRDGQSGGVSSYDVPIYCKRSLPLWTETETPSGAPDYLRGAKLRAMEKLQMDWTAIAQLKAQDAPHPGELLKSGMSPGLRKLFAVDPKGKVRIWWDVDALELRELAWELALEDETRKVSFVRGLPPGRPRPVLPVEGSLRIAVIQEASLLTAEFQRIFCDLNLQPTFIELSKDLRQQIRAISSDFDVLHLGINAGASPGYEGVLALSSDSSDTLPPSVLSELLRGSHIGLLTFTAPEPNTEAFPGFAYLGYAPFTLPTMVAPVGQVPEADAICFWREFFGSFVADFKVEQAFKRARKRVPNSRHALFLRNIYEQIFQRGPIPPAESQPELLNAELELSTTLVQRLEKLRGYLGLPPEVEAFVQSQKTRQEDLSKRLEPWTQPQPAPTVSI